MNELLNKIDAKIDKLDDRLDKVDVTLVKQESNLAEHMRRTDLLEAQHASLGMQLEPIKAHVSRVQGVVRTMTYIIPILITICLTIWRYLVS